MGFVGSWTVMSFPYCIPIFAIAFFFQCCHETLKDKLLVTKTNQFCTAQWQVENSAVLATAFVIT